MTTDKLARFMEQYKSRVEALLLQSARKKETPQRLGEAMMYSLEAGGKRVRPLLLYAVLDCFRTAPEKGDAAACSLEMIHTYSLIHDDLPAMDDDDLRRGKPTSHRRFDEATAILAGDALLTRAFQLAADDRENSDEKKIRLLQLLTAASGAEGMVGGQMEDMQAEEQTEITSSELAAIHDHKTGDLLAVALQMGGVLSDCTEIEQSQLDRYGRCIGLAFQVKDDLLDVEGDEAEIGKPVGSDETNNKHTYVRLMGIEGAREFLDQLLRDALDALGHIDADTEILSDLARYIAQRTA
nr:farnesyl diphosphate synthase [Alkalicoccus urumqiensis]